MKQFIVAGGGVPMTLENPLLFQYILQQTNATKSSVCLLPQAGGEDKTLIIDFYRTFTALDTVPNHLSLFQPHTADIEDFLMSQAVIYVGGGNTKSLLALWREWELDRILHQALANGTVLAGVSAGAICWFEQGVTSSIPGAMTLLPCLGFLPGSCVPHFDSQPERRPAFHRLIASGEAKAGYAFDDGAAGHFIDGKIHAAVSIEPDAKGYYVEQVDGVPQETPLDTRYLQT